MTESKPFRSKRAAWWGAIVLMIPATVWAVGGKPATKLLRVVDTRAMEPGFTRWVADLYNSNLWLYGLLVVGIMVGMGLTLGYVFDMLVRLLGIDLSKLNHAE